MSSNIEIEKCCICNLILDKDRLLKYNYLYYDAVYCLCVDCYLKNGANEVRKIANRKLTENSFSRLFKL